MQFSYSSLKKFLICPKQYYEIKVAKNFEDKSGEAAIYGKEVHKAIEEYIRDGTPMPKNYGKHKNTVDNIMSFIPKGEIKVEHQLAVNNDMDPVAFEDPSYVVRGIIDFLSIDKDDVAWIVDWKTGNSRYADVKQLSLLALLVFYCFPQVRMVKGFLMFLGSNHFIPNKDYFRSQVPDIWEQFAEPLTRLGFAFQTNNWPPNPNGLCRRFCPVATCTFYGGGI